MWSAIGSLAPPPSQEQKQNSSKEIVLNKTELPIVKTEESEPHSCKNTSNIHNLNKTSNNNNNNNKKNNNDNDNVTKTASSTPLVVLDSHQKVSDNEFTNKSSKNVDNLKAWEIFSQQRLKSSFYLGVALVSGFPTFQNKSHIKTNSERESICNVVDVDLWNTYWSKFSDQFAKYIDDTQIYLNSEENEIKRRRVIVAASLLLESHMEIFEENLTNFAYSFGAIEHVSRERSIIMFQFTCTRSAEIFSAWASSLKLGDIFENSNIIENIYTSSKLLVRLVSHDTNKITSTLKLGENILLSTPFVEGLFKGIFDAVKVNYDTGSFIIDFESKDAAKIAIHSLQISLIKIFGLTLRFS